MHKGFIKIAAISGALSVALGAFAAHGLKQVASPDVIQMFETAVRYQFYHTIALMLIAILYKDFASKYLKWAGYSFIVGMGLFSGSLYLLTYFKINSISMNWLGAITPFGGLLFILGWLLLFIAVIKKN